ncbi:MAG: prolipoprotein diacylglyceryl transferase [Bdellovibrionales bacterium]|nr:prolipoprotein diacylglyceryl transferase [Bdellovibrionales bacterium]
MFLFLLLYFVLARSLRNEVFKKTIFYIFIFYYSLMRFVFEFFKPYERIFFGLNIFQWICIILLFYSACFAYRQIKEDLFNRQ